MTRNAPLLVLGTGLMLVVAVLTLLGVASGALADATSTSRRADRASEIEQRLFAPCCWNQTLDVHESELSTALRIEIRERLSRGASAAEIEDELARRFGERIRAVPGVGDVRRVVPVTIGVAMVLSLFALLWFVRRGRKRLLMALRMMESTDSHDAAYDAALDLELGRVLGITENLPRGARTPRTSGS